MKKNPVCSVAGCETPAYCEVLLYDVYTDIEEVFMERDYTCPFLCRQHMAENEMDCQGIRAPRGDCVYPFTNQEQALGFSVYKPISSVK